MHKRRMIEIDNLLEVMNRLRGEGGCNWDKKQTHESLTPFLLEEAYEVVDALDAKDMSNLKEELGDLLFQIVFHSKIASENNQFSLEDVAIAISEKLIRRHPHVFGEPKNLDAEEVILNWSKLKEKEKQGLDRKRVSILDDIPISMPALQRSLKIQEKASGVGFDWNSTSGVLEKVREEFKELEDEIVSETSTLERKEEEFGDVLFTLVNLSRFLKVDPEAALRKANNKFKERFQFIEKNAAQDQRSIGDLSKDEMEELWQISKNTGNR